MSDVVHPLPAVDETNRFFWTSGQDGTLRFGRCERCRSWVHPPQPGCPACRSGQISPEAVSGRATVLGWTVNHQQWHPAFEPPYVIAVVAMDDAPLVRLTTNIIDAEIDQLRVGLPVEVTFEQHSDADGEVWLPLFRPVAP